MIKPAGPATGLLVSPIMEGGRVYQLLMLVGHLTRETSNGRWSAVFNTKRHQRLVSLKKKVTRHLIWMVMKKLPDFDPDRGWKFRYVDTQIEGTNWILLYKNRLKPAKWYKDDPEPSRIVVCVECGWKMARSDIEQLGWLKQCPKCHPPAPEPEVHEPCLDCDGLGYIHRMGNTHCAACEEDECEFNHHRYDPPCDEEEHS